MSSKSPCCPDGALPELKNVDYEPQGERFELTQTCEVYVAPGASHKEDSWHGRPVVVMCCDAFGPWSGTHRKLADRLALSLDMIVVLPDPFGGSGGVCPKYGDEGDRPRQLGFNRFTLDLIGSVVWDGMSFMRRHPWESKIQPIFANHLIQYLENKGVKRFAMLGFCFGSWVVMKSCNDDAIAPRVTCGIHFHPSSELIEKTAFKMDDIALCHGCRNPQLIHATKNESKNWKPDGAAHAALQDNPDVSEVHFSLAPQSQNHGFMTRVDGDKNEKGAAAVEQGLALAESFLRKHNQ